MEVDPLDSNVSDTARIVYGNSSSEGITAISAFSASAPCPISRRPGPRDTFVSPTEYAGKLYWCIYLLVVTLASKPSIFCTSDNGANVTTSQICVCPRVNIAEPCTLGIKSTSAANGRIWLIARPSGRLWSFKIILRTVFF